MAFGMNVKVLQKFTSEPDKLDRALERVAREPNGLSTHTYDAVDDAIRMLVRHAPRTRERRLMKRAVVVITDGFPVGDTVSAPTVNRARQCRRRERLCGHAAILFAHDVCNIANSLTDAVRCQWTLYFDWWAECVCR